MSRGKALAVGLVHRSAEARRWEQARKLAVLYKLEALCRAMARKWVVARLVERLSDGSKGRKPESMTADSSPEAAARTIGQRPAGRRILLRQVRSR